MKCSPKTMLKIGVALVLLLAGGYVVFPQFRPIIIGLAPFALFALCPLSMFFAMRGMNKDQHGHPGCASCEHEESHAHSEKNIK